MPTTALILLPLLLIGHVALCVLVFNRIHAVPLSCNTIRKIEKVIFLWVVMGPAAYLWAFGFQIDWMVQTAARDVGRVAALLYVTASYLSLVYVTTSWLLRRMTSRQPDQLLANHTRVVDIAEQLGRLPIGKGRSAFLGKVPGNNSFQLAINDKSLSLPRLTAELDGLTIAHLSDLHFTGHVTRDFFDAVIDHTNSLDADLIAVTGDIIDKDECLPWIPETLGRLRARHGVFYVLGNHDKRVRSVPELRQTLQSCGLIDLGGRWLLHEVRGRQLLLAGNELPWFGKRRDLDAAQPDGVSSDILRILLAHTPDQISWARSMRFDLMLAGHNHGGQLRFPLIGPVASPSKYGVRYASGLFFEPPTLMHVSRGISALHPIRIDCLPELTKLILKAHT